MPETHKAQHVFIYVVRSLQDPFAGIRLHLEQEGFETHSLALSEAQFDVVDATEYSWRRLIRLFSYREIFRSLEDRLDALINPDSETIFLYMADEGVWAVFLANYIAKRGFANIVPINAQHGLAVLSPPPLPMVRRILNRISQLLTGYPVIGYGSAGGGGAEPFHCYLTYDQNTADFAEKQSGRLAMAAPYLIKHDLIAGYSRLRKDVVRARPRVLFTMNINISGSPVLCNTRQTFDALLGMAQVLEDQGLDLVLRLHPGMNRQAEEQRFNEHPISRFAKLDSSNSIQQSMAETDILMSLLSTTLWESRLLGIVPVQVLCECCHPVELGFEREMLDLSKDVPEQISRIVGLLSDRKPDFWRESATAEWMRFKSEILDSDSSRGTTN